MHDPLEIANWFIKRHRPKIFSLMHILKLSYFAHALNLAMNKEPLSKTLPEAWEFGPVFPEVYFTFRKEGYKEIAETQNVQDEKGFTENETKVLDIVYKLFKDYSAFGLSRLTHKEGFGWHEAVEAVKGEWESNIKMDNEKIKESFEALIKKTLKDSNT